MQLILFTHLILMRKYEYESPINIHWKMNTSTSRFKHIENYGKELCCAGEN